MDTPTTTIKLKRTAAALDRIERPRSDKREPRRRAPPHLKEDRVCECRPLTDELLFGKLAQGGSVRVGHDGDKLTFEFPAQAPPAPALPPALAPVSSDA